MAIHRRLLTAVLLLLLVLGAVNAEADPISYTFTIQTYVVGEPQTPAVPSDTFTVSFTVPDYITHTGLFKLPSPATVQGNAITHVGTNVQGIWIFGRGVGDYITDAEWHLDFNPGEFTLNRGPGDEQMGYITAPTRITGYQVQGLVDTFPYPPDPGFFAYAQLDVRDDAAPIPEPVPLLLLGSGVFALVFFSKA